MPEHRRRRFLRELDRPRFLYKYLDFNPKNALSYKKAKDFIVESTLYLARPESLNDPFDFCAHWSVPDAEQFMAWATESAEGLRRRGDPRSKEQLIANVLQRLKSEDDLVNSSFANISKQHGIACFATNPRSIRMWSHYASAHTGVCLIFNPARSLERLAVALRVTYSDDFPTLSFPADVPHVVDKVMRVKSRLWAEEGEYRYIDGALGGSSVRFDASALTGIILGARFPTESIEPLRRLLRGRQQKTFPSIKMFRARVSKAAYELRVWSEHHV